MEFKNVFRAVKERIVNKTLFGIVEKFKMSSRIFLVYPINDAHYIINYIVFDSFLKIHIYVIIKSILFNNELKSKIIN